MMTGASDTSTRRFVASQPKRWLSQMVVWLFLLTMLVFTFLAWRAMDNAVAREVKVDFGNHVQDVNIAIKNRMVGYEHVLRSGAALFAASTYVSRKEWRSYVDGLDIEQYYPGILGIGYAKLLTPDQVASHEAVVRAEGFAEYRVRPAGPRDIYTSIVYLEPFTTMNQRAFGYDMFSQATRREAMERARDSGQPSMSGKVTLLQENSTKVQAGMLVYVPVYRKDMPLTSVAQRRAALEGYVYSPFRMDDLMQGILGNRANPLIEIYIYDGVSDKAADLMYDSQPEFDAPSRYQSVEQLSLGGQTWSVLIRGTHAFEASIDHSKPRLVLAGGLVVTALLLAVLWIFQSARERALQLASRMTVDLRDSENRYARVISGTNDGIWDWNVATDEAYYSPRFIELLGYASGQFSPVLDSFDRLVHPDDRPRMQAAIRAHWKQQAPYDVEARVKTKNNGYRYFRAKGQANFGADGRVLTMAGSLSDISDRKHAEHALQSSEQRFRALVENAPVGIFLTDVAGNCELVNSRWCNMVGISQQQAMGPGWSDALHPDDRQHVFEAWGNAVRNGYEFALDFRFLNQGKEVWVASQAVALTDEYGEKSGYIGTIFDLTERMRIELMKNEFISTVSHELRTPLTSIRGSLGLVIGGAVGPIPQQAEKLLKIAANNSERLVRLINDILDIEKLESGKLNFDFQRCDLQNLVEQALSANQAFAAQLGVMLILDGPLTDAFALLDVDRVMQVMTNLLSNAAKFSPQGEQITVSLLRRAGCLRVEVRDRGPGIASEFQDRIFQKFAQADSSDTRAKGGTGLGLNISKAIIERHGGAIGFHSVPGQGATFYFEIPQALAAPATEALDEQPCSGQSKGRILVCEDDADIASLLCLMLQQGGFATDVAATAAQARTLLAANPANHYLAMTLDIGLPDQDGLSFARSLRSQDETRDLPIIVVSAQAENAKMNASALGLIDCLDKPIDESRLLAAIRQVSRRASNRILHVEDDADVVHVVASLLGGEVEVVQAETVAEAQRLLQCEHFAMVILDIGLPDGSGTRLLPLLHSIDKNYPVIIFSGEDFDKSLSQQVSAVLVKARTSDDTLLRTISQLIARSSRAEASINKSSAKAPE